MPIDPVVVLAEELRNAEHTARAARARNEDEHLTCLLARTVSLYNEISETVPTSALGAGELVCLAAANIASIDPRRSSQLQETAGRLKSGIRRQDDLIGLRKTAADFADSRFGEIGRSSAMLLHLAVRGAARPVIVYRAVEWTRTDVEKEFGTI